MSTFLPLLAHTGVPENAWLGVSTISAMVVTLIFLAYVAGLLTIKAPGDLLLPMAVVVLIAGLAGTLGDAINDQGPWAVPIGLVALVALLVVAFRGPSEPVGLAAQEGADDQPRGASFGSTLFLASAGAMIFATLLLMPVIEYWWFGDGTDDPFTWSGVTWYWEDGYGQDPSEVPLPALGDATMTAELLDGPDENGMFTIRVSVEGGTLGDGSPGVRPDDPETELWARFDVGPVFLTPPVPDACIEADPCTSADFVMSLPPGFGDDAPDRVTVHLYTKDRFPFSPPLSAEVPLPTGG